jgi:hypothetical protein
VFGGWRVPQVFSREEFLIKMLIEMTSSMVSTVRVFSSTPHLNMARAPDAGNFLEPRGHEVRGLIFHPFWQVE